MSPPTLLASILALSIIGIGSARGDEPVAARVSSSLVSADAQIRQFAFDGDDATYFASASNPKADDHLTMTFDRPVAVRGVAIRSGRADGSDPLEAGVVEGSEDGSTFTELARFAEGSARGDAVGKKLKAIRIKATGDAAHPLVVREMAIEADEPLARFRYPVEFKVDVDDAPEMKDWADDVARLCESWYSRINDALQSDGYKPATRITLTMNKAYDGVAEAGGSQITGSVRYFKAHPDDKGAMIHETVHIVQRYRSRSNPSWLVEGLADYFRFFVYEPGMAGPLDARRARYNASYRVSAAFLDFVARTYDKELILQLNRLMRAGKYKADSFKELTGKTLQELDAEWKASIQGKD